MTQNGIYTYEQNPFFGRSFLIFKQDPSADGNFARMPVGDYTVLDWDEDMSLSEKKVMNVVSIMNGHGSLMPMTAEDTHKIKTHQAYYEAQRNLQARVVLYNQECVSGNAVLTLSSHLKGE